MPEGLVRTDLNSTGTSFKNGVPVTKPLTFGQPVTEPHQFGATVPASSTSFHSNPVTLPKNFGNQNPPVS